MPFNGSGVYVAPSLPGSFNPAISGQQASPSDWNSLLTDLSTALSTTITSDGQSTVTANIPFAGFKLTGVGNATLTTDAPNLGQVQSGAGVYAADTGAADAYVIAPSPAIAAYVVGQKFRFLVANTNLTIQPTLAVNGLTAGIIANADGGTIARSSLPANGIVEVTVSAVTTGTPTFQMQPANAAIATFGLRSYLTGLTASTAGSSGTMSIAVGCATDSTNVAMMILASAFTKTTSAWAVGTGNGGLDAGSIANATVYHWYLIQRPGTGLVDLIFSLSASAPTLPANYTLYRRIFSAITDGSAHWVKFIQKGDTFLWSVPTADVTALTTSATAALQALNVPTGIAVTALMSWRLQITTTACNVLLTDPAQADSATATGALFTFGLNTLQNQDMAFGNIQVGTNTSAQIRLRSDGTSGTLWEVTNGWIDSRGRNA